MKGNYGDSGATRQNDDSGARRDDDRAMGYSFTPRVDKVADVMDCWMVGRVFHGFFARRERQSGKLEMVKVGRWEANSAEPVISAQARGIETCTPARARGE